ncbi:MAG: hypothetical protein R3B82_09795 [Sandaracinaceae bacterium]
MLARALRERGASDLADAVEALVDGVGFHAEHHDEVLAEIPAVLDAIESRCHGIVPAIPIDPDARLDLPFDAEGVGRLVSALASARYGLFVEHPHEHPLLLPSPLASRHARGEGGTDVVELVDLGSATRTILGDLARRLIDGGVFSPLFVPTSDPRSLRAAHLAEAVARLAPDRFEDARRALAECYHVDVEDVTGLLGAVGLATPAILAAADDPETHAAVEEDRRVAWTMGLGAMRPGWVVEDRVTRWPENIASILRPAGAA